MNDLHASRRLGVGLLALSMVFAGCSTAGAPPTATPTPPVATSPDDPVTATPSTGSGGSTDPSDPGDLGGGTLVVPRPGQLDVHDVAADELRARVDGSTIVVTVTWTSGVEPCNVLDSVVVQQGPGRYAITLREGHGPEDVVCIMIAQIHRTEIAIPNVAPGTYQITDTGGRAVPIEVTVG